MRDDLENIAINKPFLQEITKRLTGKATLRLVPSNATINVITDSVPKAIYNLGDGLNVAGSTPAVVTLCRNSGLEVSLQSSSWWIMETCGARTASLASLLGFGSIADKLVGRSRKSVV